MSDALSSSSSYLQTDLWTSVRTEDCSQCFQTLFKPNESAHEDSEHYSFK